MNHPSDETSPRPGCDRDEHGAPLLAPDPDATARAAALFRALGDPGRLGVLQCLVEERCVSEVAEVLGDSLSTVSQRLRVLKAERLVHRRRDGRHVLYRLADDHVSALVHNALEHAREAGGAAEARPTESI